MKISSRSKRLDKKDIIVIVPGWMHRKFKKYKPFILLEHNIPKNYGYIRYNYSHDMLNSDPILTKKNILKLTKRIETDLNKLNKKSKRNFYGYGQSLGNLFLCISSKDIYFKKIVYILPGDNLAEMVWNGEATEKIKKKMEKDGMTLPKLKELWKEISPDHQFKRKARKTEYYIKNGKRDKIIPQKNSKGLIKYLKEKKIKLVLHENMLNHYIEIILELIYPRTALKFLTKTSLH